MYRTPWCICLPTALEKAATQRGKPVQAAKSDCFMRKECQWVGKQQIPYQGTWKLYSRTALNHSKATIKWNEEKNLWKRTRNVSILHVSLCQHVIVLIKGNFASDKLVKLKKNGFWVVSVALFDTIVFWWCYTMAVKQWLILLFCSSVGIDNNNWSCSIYNKPKPPLLQRPHLTAFLVWQIVTARMWLKSKFTQINKNGLLYLQYIFSLQHKN